MALQELLASRLTETFRTALCRPPGRVHAVLAPQEPLTVARSDDFKQTHGTTFPQFGVWQGILYSGWQKTTKKQKKHDISQWRSPPTHTRNDTGELGVLENEASMPWQHYKGPASPYCVSGKLRRLDRWRTALLWTPQSDRQHFGLGPTTPKLGAAADWIETVRCVDDAPARWQSSQKRLR